METEKIWTDDDLFNLWMFLISGTSLDFDALKEKLDLDDEPHGDREQFDEWLKQYKEYKQSKNQSETDTAIVIHPI